MADKTPDDLVDDALRENFGAPAKRTAPLAAPDFPKTQPTAAPNEVAKLLTEILGELKRLNSDRPEPARLPDRPQPPSDQYPVFQAAPEQIVRTLPEKIEFPTAPVEPQRDIDASRDQRVVLPERPVERNVERAVTIDEIQQRESEVNAAFWMAGEVDSPFKPDKGMPRRIDPEFRPEPFQTPQEQVEQALAEWGKPSAEQPKQDRRPESPWSFKTQEKEPAPQQDTNLDEFEKSTQQLADAATQLASTTGSTLTAMVQLQQQSISQIKQCEAQIAQLREVVQQMMQQGGGYQPGGPSIRRTQNKGVG